MCAGPGRNPRARFVLGVARESGRARGKVRKAVCRNKHPQRILVCLGVQGACHDPHVKGCLQTLLGVRPEWRTEPLVLLDVAGRAKVKKPCVGYARYKGSSAGLVAHKSMGLIGMRTDWVYNHALQSPANDTASQLFRLHGKSSSSSWLTRNTPSCGSTTAETVTELLIELLTEPTATSPLSKGSPTSTVRLKPPRSNSAPARS